MSSLFQLQLARAGHFLSRSGAKESADLDLRLRSGLKLPFDELSFYRLAFRLIFVADFGIHKRGDRAFKPRIMLPIFLECQSARFEAGLLWALLIEKDLDRLVDQLIDGAPLKFA